MTDKLTPEDQNILAAEFALGLLEGDELADAQARLRTDAAFAAEVAEYEAKKQKHEQENKFVKRFIILHSIF